MVGATVFTSQISVVEVFSTFNRRIREGELSLADYATLGADFTSLCNTDYQLVAFAVALRDRASNLLEQHPLRAYDAIQLATAIATNEILTAAGLTPLMFLSADNRLLNAARVTGLATENPNDH